MLHGKITIANLNLSEATAIKKILPKPEWAGTAELKSD